MRWYDQIPAHRLRMFLCEPLSDHSNHVLQISERMLLNGEKYGIRSQFQDGQAPYGAIRSKASPEQQECIQQT